MCQLIFINSHKDTLNRTLLLMQLLEDSRTYNVDGWGLLTKEKEIFKTKLTPWNTLDFGSLLREKVGTEPVLAHVRAASKGTEVKDEFSHPFETRDLVLAHNGTLVPKEELKGYEGKLDSEVFLLELQKRYSNGETTGNLVTSLQETMKGFTGKFAFLIYEKVTKKYYAVRGRTADLHICYLTEPVPDKPKEIKSVGYIINTDDAAVLRSVDTALELMRSLGRTVPGFSKAVILKMETIYEMGSTDIKELGPIPQNEKPMVVTYYGGRGSAGRWNPVTRTWDYDNPALGVGSLADNWGGYDAGDDDDVPHRPALTSVTPKSANHSSEDAVELHKWMKLYGLTPFDLDVIMERATGQSILECEPGDIRTFFKHVAPKLTCSKWFRESVLHILNKKSAVGIPFSFYLEHSFQFPYILEPDQKGFLHALEDHFKESLDD